MSLRTLLNFAGDRLSRLPLAIVYVTERCNSRCTSCDFWKHGTAELPVERARELARELKALGCEMVLLTGGEVLFHPEWDAVASSFREQGLRLWLLTAGLSLQTDAPRVRALADRVTVSLDGATGASYRAIRGVGAFERVVAGIEELVRRDGWVSIRTTIQRRNYREMPELIRLARRIGVREISFLPVDVASSVAFAREGEAHDDRLALAEEDLEPFESVLRSVERDFASELRSGFIAESPEKLRLLHRYFAALHGRGSYPLPRCNAPRFSVVVRATGELQPCHFIAGTRSGSADFAGAMNDPALMALRRRIRNGEREECRRRVCPLWKSPFTLASGRAFGS